MRYTKSSLFKAMMMAAVVPFIASNLTATAQITLPEPTQLLETGTVVTPPMVIGMRIDPKDPFSFKFLVDMGEARLDEAAERQEYEKLVKYFLTALTIPNNDMWVNLSPYEADKIIPGNFALTEMGFELLAQDYTLKQLSASMLNPDSEVGKGFWEKVNAKASEMYGTINVPVNTFNKVWIVPAEASVFEKDDTVMVVGARLKVMLEEDYLALENNKGNAKYDMNKVSDKAAKDINGFASDVLRQVVIPALEEEVNNGANFAPLRQAYQSIILAIWYKQALRESLLAKIYADQSKVAGVDNPESGVDNQGVFDQYLAAFDKGAFSFIKEDIDPVTKRRIPREYFSGGIKMEEVEKVLKRRQVTAGGEGAMALTDDLARRYAATQTRATTGNVRLVGVTLDGRRSNADQSMLVPRVVPVVDLGTSNETTEKLIAAMGTVAADFSPGNAIVDVPASALAAESSNLGGPAAEIKVTGYTTVVDVATGSSVAVAVGERSDGAKVVIPSAKTTMPAAEILNLTKAASVTPFSNSVTVTGGTTAVALADSGSGEVFRQAPMTMVEPKLAADFFANPLFEEIQSAWGNKTVPVVDVDRAGVPANSLVTVVAKAPVQELDVMDTMATQMAITQVQATFPELKAGTPEFDVKVASVKTDMVNNAEGMAAALSQNAPNLQQSVRSNQGVFFIHGFSAGADQQMSPAQKQIAGVAMDLVKTAQEAGRPVFVGVTSIESPDLEGVVQEKLGPTGYQTVSFNPRLLTTKPALVRMLVNEENARDLVSSPVFGALQNVADRINGVSSSEVTAAPLGLKAVHEDAVRSATQMIEGARATNPQIVKALAGVMTGSGVVDQLSARERRGLEKYGLIDENQTVPPVVVDAYKAVVQGDRAMLVTADGVRINRALNDTVSSAARVLALSNLTSGELRKELAASSSREVQEQINSFPANTQFRVSDAGTIEAVAGGTVVQNFGSVQSMNLGVTSAAEDQARSVVEAANAALNIVVPAVTADTGERLEDVLARIAGGDASVRESVEAMKRAVESTVPNAKNIEPTIRLLAQTAGQRLTNPPAAANQQLNDRASAVTEKLIALGNIKRTTQGEPSFSTADEAVIRDIVRSVENQDEMARGLETATQTIALGETSVPALLAVFSPANAFQETPVQRQVREQILASYKPAGTLNSVGFWGDTGAISEQDELYSRLQSPAVQRVNAARSIVAANQLVKEPGQAEQVLRGMVNTARAMLGSQTLSPSEKKDVYGAFNAVLTDLGKLKGAPEAKLNNLGEKASEAHQEVLQITRQDLGVGALVSLAGDIRREAGQVPGGIDLDSAMLSLVVKKDGNGVPLPLSDQDADMLRFDGFVPVIKEIQQLNSLPILE